MAWWISGQSLHGPHVHRFNRSGQSDQEPQLHRHQQRGQAHGQINQTSVVATDFVSVVEDRMAQAGQQCGKVWALIFMSKLTWSKTKPTNTGWYWCRNIGGNPGEIWEAPVRVEMYHSGMRCCWLSAFGEAMSLYEKDFSDAALWAGPIKPPS